MTKHIGIVGCSAEGAALCYRTICEESGTTLGEYFHPEVSMHTHSLGAYMQCIGKNDWQGVALLMLSSSKKLHGAGADFAICPDNTIHQACRLSPADTGFNPFTRHGSDSIRANRMNQSLSLSLSCH
jgi:aspartate racemase